jgi:hypothetical protein
MYIFCAAVDCFEIMCLMMWGDWITYIYIFLLYI